jgi:glycosyltransferase involved in cell wall biosynthesis
LENPYIHESIKKYICIRPEIQEHIINNFSIDREKTKVIYNPIDEEKFNLNNVNDKNYVLFVGTIDYLRKQTLFDLMDYSKTINKEFWIIGENKSDYLSDLLVNNHVKYFKPTNDIESFTKNCSETGGILLGRTTIEGWMCGKPGWIYNVDSNGDIINKKTHEVPNDLDKYISKNVSEEIINECLTLL